MTILFIRTIIVYGFVIFSLRIMGKRQIGQLQPSELVVAIMISDLATMPMSDVSVPLLYGIVPILTLVICEMALSILSLKSERIRVLLSGKPQILIKEGRLCRGEMLRSRINIDDLMEEIRKAGYFSLSDIDTLILETGGAVSVIPVSDCTPLTRGDMNIGGRQAVIPYVFVSDGKIRPSELRRAGKDIAWLEDIIRRHNIPSAKNVFMLSRDGEGNIFVQRRDGK